MRTSEAALAIIRRDQRDESSSRWLALWNPKWNAFHFVGGHRRPEETYRDCLIRELFEELSVREGVDYHLAPTPLTHLDYVAWSNQAKAETSYSIELFEVALVERSDQPIEAIETARWLNETEIRSETCQDGRPVSPTMKLILTKANLLGP